MMTNGRPVKIVYEVFPQQIQGKIKGFTSASTDEYIIMIDSSRHPQAQRHTLGHELAHIYLGHFDRSGVAWKLLPDAWQYSQDKELEREANANAWKYYRLFINGKLQEARQWKK